MNAIVYNQTGSYIEVYDKHIEVLVYKNVDYGFGSWVEFSNSTIVPFDNITKIESIKCGDNNVRLRLYTDDIITPIVNDIFSAGEVDRVYERVVKK